MKLNEKQKMAVVMMVLGLAVIGLGTLIFFKLQERRSLNKKMEEFVTKERDASEKIKRIPKLREERDTLASRIDEYAAILPKDAHVEHDAFVDTIDSYRRDTDIVISKAEYIKPRAAKKRKKGAKKKTEKFIRHRYKFALLGTVPHLIAFMNKIENHTRFLKVDAFDIRPVGGGGGGAPELELDAADDPLKEIQLTITTYTYFRGSDRNL